MTVLDDKISALVMMHATADLIAARPARSRWTVVDVPAQNEKAEQLALVERNTRRSDCWKSLDCPG